MEGLKPCTERPSSVRVPVLSNTKVVTRPAILTLGGEIQNIFWLLSLRIAKIIPHDMAAGSAGGTAITMRFKERSISVETDASYRSKMGKIAIKPTTAMRAIIATNFMPSS